MLIVILSVIRIKYIVSTPEKSMLYYSTMSVPKNKQYLDPHKIVIIFCLFVFWNFYLWELIIFSLNILPYIMTAVQWR